MTEGPVNLPSSRPVRAPRAFPAPTLTPATPTLSSGELDINSNTALGTGNTFIINGGSIDNTSGSAVTLTNNNAQTWGGNNFSYGGTNDLNLGTGRPSPSLPPAPSPSTAPPTSPSPETSPAPPMPSLRHRPRHPHPLRHQFLLRRFADQLRHPELHPRRRRLQRSHSAPAPRPDRPWRKRRATATLRSHRRHHHQQCHIYLWPQCFQRTRHIEKASAGSNTLSSTLLSSRPAALYYPIEVDSGSTLTLSAANSINAGSLTSTRTVPLMGAGTGKHQRHHHRRHLHHRSYR